MIANFGDFVIGDLRAVHDRHRSRAENLQNSFFIQNNRRIFVDPDAEIIRVIRNGRNQPADASALGKMLVDDDIFQKSEPGRKTARCFSADAGSIRRARSSRCTFPPRPALVPAKTILVSETICRSFCGKFCPAKHGNKPHLVAAGNKNARHTVEQSVGIRSK